MLDFLLTFLLLWFVGGPITTLLHELGHACTALAFTDGWVRAELGSSGPSKMLNVGRLTLILRLNTGAVGFYRYGSAPSSTMKRVMISAAGPATSLITAVACFWIAADTAFLPNVLETVIAWTGLFSIFQFLATAIPFHYPPGWPGYAGMASDGERIRQALRHDTGR